MTAYMLTRESSNSKTGAMPVTTSPKSTCPDCPLKDNGCYFDQSYMRAIWNKLSAAVPNEPFKNGRANITPISWSQLLSTVASFALDQIWRHNQAGDLPGHHNAIDAKALSDLVDANARAGARGFTYTHKPVLGDAPMAKANRAAIADANTRGFTINLSANSLAQVDRLKALNIGPVVTLLPSDTPKAPHVIKTAAGHRVIPCPKHYRDITCGDCKLCARQRDVVVGFPSHGAGKKKIDAVIAAAA